MFHNVLLVFFFLFAVTSAQGKTGKNPVGRPQLCHLLFYISSLKSFIFIYVNMVFQISAKKPPPKKIVQGEKAKCDPRLDNVSIYIQCSGSGSVGLGPMINWPPESRSGIPDP
jgi:hypothetical protein